MTSKPENHDNDPIDLDAFGDDNPLFVLLSSLKALLPDSVEDPLTKRVMGELGAVLEAIENAAYHEGYGNCLTHLADEIAYVKQGLDTCCG